MVGEALAYVQGFGLKAIAAVYGRLTNSPAARGKPQVAVFIKKGAAMRKRIFATAQYLTLVFATLSAGAALASDADQWIAASDDLEKHSKAFLQAAMDLVENGTCTGAEFIENGGGVRSTSFGPRPVYFMYCGGATVANRLYLDAATGEVFR